MARNESHRASTGHDFLDYENVMKIFADWEQNGNLPMVVTANRMTWQEKLAYDIEAGLQVTGEAYVAKAEADLAVSNTAFDVLALPFTYELFPSTFGLQNAGAMAIVGSAGGGNELTIAYAHANLMQSNVYNMPVSVTPADAAAALGEAALFARFVGQGLKLANFAAERTVANGKFYSVAYETKLDASVWGGAMAYTSTEQMRRLMMLFDPIQLGRLKWRS